MQRTNQALTSRGAEVEVTSLGLACLEPESLTSMSRDCGSANKLMSAPRFLARYPGSRWIRCLGSRRSYFDQVLDWRKLVGL